MSIDSTKITLLKAEIVTSATAIAANLSNPDDTALITSALQDAEEKCDDLISLSKMLNYIQTQSTNIQEAIVAGLVWFKNI